ncbi:MAG TPA: FAD-dependent oxidoreductase [Acetobacteraceae bacterium]|nr:FAD-dependent oxidoreductase [Acetobacteraceae bacterium]
MTLSRRALIHLVGEAGGAAAAYRTMAAMGLLAVPEAYAGAPALPPGRGRRIVIIGAGIAGMVIALELEKAGYAPLILEARKRPGGRNWSLRAGDTVQETDSVQHVSWDSGPHLYFNPGPARIPYHHDGILSYCRELGVALEVMCNENRGALMQDDAAFDGAPQSNRRVVSDTRGYVAELAAKAVNQAALDGPVTATDKERLRAFLRAFGALDRDLTYHGSDRAGWAESPGGGLESGKPNSPLDLRAILASEFWRGPMQFGEFADMSATMLQPVGGMGRIGEAFGRRLRRRIVLGAEVTELRRTPGGARVIWRDKHGARRTTEAPIVVVTVPLTVLREISADFAPEVSQAIAAVGYVPAGKVAFQAERRFWELDHRIYGGISWTSRNITQIWYPTAGINQSKGVLLGGYIWSQDLGEAFAAKSPAQRLDDALADGERVHPGYRRWLGKGIAVAWKKIPFSLSAWAEWTKAARTTHYPTLLAGDGPFLFAGEHMSWITGWQEGAVRSAHVGLQEIARRTAPAHSPTLQAMHGSS